MVIVMMSWGGVAAEVLKETNLLMFTKYVGLFLGFIIINSKENALP